MLTATGCSVYGANHVAMINEECNCSWGNMHFSLKETDARFLTVGDHSPTGNRSEHRKGRTSASDDRCVKLALVVTNFVYLGHHAPACSSDGSRHVSGNALDAPLTVVVKRSQPFLSLLFGSLITPCSRANSWIPARAKSAIVTTKLQNLWNPISNLLDKNLSSCCQGWRGFLDSMTRTRTSPSYRLPEAKGDLTLHSSYMTGFWSGLHSDFS